MLRIAKWAVCLLLVLVIAYTILYIVVGRVVRDEARADMIQHLQDAGAQLEYHDNGWMVIFRGPYDAKAIHLPCDRNGQNLIGYVMGFDRLESLQLENCVLTATEVGYISGRPSLTSITLRHVTIEPASLETLKRNLPGAKIVVEEQ